MPNVFKVTFPATITLEISALHAETLEHVIRTAFDVARPYDPFAGCNLDIPHDFPFSVGFDAQVKTCVLAPSDAIEIVSG